MSLSDIVIPGTNNVTDVQARISTGESIHIIRGTKGNKSELIVANRMKSVGEMFVLQSKSSFFSYRQGIKLNEALLSQENKDLINPPH